MDFFYEGYGQAYKTIQIRHVNQRWLDDQVIDWSDCWKNYCATGGIPHAVGEFHCRKAISDTTWRTYIDWIIGTWSKLRTPERSLAAVARRICETLNSRVSFETIKKGTDIQSANTVRSLLELQEDNFAIHVIPRYDLHKDKFLPSKLKKVYPIDPFIARVWAAIGWNIRRLFKESIPSLSLDECAFLTQTYRWSKGKEVGYLYSDTSKSEVDFYFDEIGFELKSNGHPTSKQLEILRQCPQAFVVNKEKLPLVTYLLGEGN
jgi:predicted AAA+ superfamily ATPase